MKQRVYNAHLFWVEGFWASLSSDIFVSSTELMRGGAIVRVIVNHSDRVRGRIY